MELKELDIEDARILHQALIEFTQRHGNVLHSFNANAARKLTLLTVKVNTLRMNTVVESAKK